MDQQTIEKIKKEIANLNNITPDDILLFEDENGEYYDWAFKQCFKRTISKRIYNMKYPDDFINKIIRGDCLEVMPEISDKSIDMILCDLPYGTTACSWDTIIPFELLWKEYKRIIKDNGAIVLTASQPFTTDLINSNRKWFRYEMIWDKVQGKQPFLAKIQPMKSHENILIFAKNKIIYNPQMRIEKSYTDKRAGQKDDTIHWVGRKRMTYIDKSERYPISIIKVNNPNKEGQHPTQKPVALFEYLIKTYTNEGDLVLDNCAGSGTTGVACKKTGRNYILIEKENKYCKIAEQRLRQEILL